MTEKQLVEGKSLADKIKKLQEFQTALHAPHLNFIRACNYEGNREMNKTISIEEGDELYDLIDTYIESKIEKLQKEFGLI